MWTEQFYSIVSEQELNEVVAGHQAGYTVPWPASSNPPPLSDGSAGVLWRRLGDDLDSPVRPLALVVREDQLRRLFGRFAQLRSDLSPLTAWCHVLTPDRFYAMRSTSLEPELNGLEAAWSGVVIAEAMLLAEKPLANLRLPACFATHSFGIARAKSLWGKISLTDVSSRMDSAHRLLRSDWAGQRNALRAAKIRSALDPVWQSLLALSTSNIGITSPPFGPIVQGLRALQRARVHKDPDEARLFAMSLDHAIPEVEPFLDLQELTPENRLRLFDRLAEALTRISSDRDVFRKTCLSMLAGYLSTVAAGGKPSLKLAETLSSRWPEITAWAYAIGGIGEDVFWTSGFDGLGRLVARELTRAFRLDEPPTCDLTVEEAVVLTDTKLSDPLVHLRIKQARIVTIAVLPGVNVFVPITESPVQEFPKDSARNERQGPYPPAIGNRDSGSAIVDALWPYILPRLEDYLKSSQGGSQGSRNKRKAGSQSHLPLKDSKA